MIRIPTIFHSLTQCRGPCTNTLATQSYIFSISIRFCGRYFCSAFDATCIILFLSFSRLFKSIFHNRFRLVSFFAWKREYVNFILIDFHFVVRKNDGIPLRNEKVHFLTFISFHSLSLSPHIIPLNVYSVFIPLVFCSCCCFHLCTAFALHLIINETKR